MLITLFLYFYPDPRFFCLVVPVYNAATDKTKILSDNQGKSGVYCFTNLTNGKNPKIYIYIF